jgi:Protein of unknown function (DUF2510)
MGAQRIRPSRAWYWVVGAMLVASVVWLVVGFIFGLSSMSRQVDGFQRVPVPGQGELTFTEPGTYVLYYEGAGASEGSMPAFSASIVSTGGDTEVQLDDYRGELTYDFSGHSGRAVASFPIDNPGKFLLRTESEVAGIQANAAVGRSIAGGVVRTILLPLVGAGILFLGGTALAVIVAIRRNRARRRYASSTMPGGRVSDAGSEGWFADPSKRHELRYWDGHRWTEHVSDRGTQAIDTLPQPTGGL